MSTHAQERVLTFKDYAWILALVLLALLSVPLLAVVGLAMQFAFVIVGPALLLVALVLAFRTPREV